MDRTTTVTKNARKIGEAAKETGLSIDTIRFYEKEGLVERSGRTDGGFRLFGPRQLQDLQFVRKAQVLGFSLTEIRELLVLRSDTTPTCAHVKALLETKMANVGEKIAELQALKRTLATAHRKCEQALGATHPTHGSRCPVLEEITRNAKTTRKP